MVNLGLVLILLTNFTLLGTSRLPALIRMMALQGLVLSLLPLGLHHEGSELRLIALVIGATTIKFGVIPQMLLRVLSRMKIRHEVEPYISTMMSLVLGGIGTLLALAIAGVLPLSADQANTLIVPASLATFFSGFLLLISRRKALTQVVGYVVMENGIYLFGLLLLSAMPMPIETGVLLDLLSGILVMGIVINHIQREFSSLDTSRLSALKEE